MSKATNKEYALSDSQGLYLGIRPNGSKLWRFKYRFLDKQKTLHLGGCCPARRMIQDGLGQITDCL